MKRTCLLISVLFVSVTCFSQTIPATDNFAGEISRIHQILGGADSTTSFCIRPSGISRDSILAGLFGGKNLTPNLKFFSAQTSIQVLPFNWLNDYNLNRPYGYNNGSLYPGRGYQTRVSGGIFIENGIFRLQFKPELVYAQNENFETFADIQGNNNNPALLRAYYATVNGIDAPERFGSSPLTHLYPGQSKMTVVFKNVEAGISTENMWWGPGVQNAIMMSNSAPGFFHWTINSANPLKTKMGSFEWQIIGGELKQSGFLPTDTSKLIYAHGLFVPKPVVTRYISALTVNWQPKWITGLFLGFSEYDYLNKDAGYHKRSIISKLFPVITGSSVRANAITDSTNGDGQDFAFSLSVRQVLKKYNAEIYFEWARNDRSGGVNDFLQEPEHSSAYTLGGRRLFELGKDQFLQVKMELTHLQLDPTFLLRGDPIWYVHLVPPQDGYTNNGRYLGAGIGPGSNSLMWDISYLKGQNSFGIMSERLVHNNDLYYFAFMGTGVYNLHWVDLCNTFYANFKMKNYLISAQLTPVYSLNYEYHSGDSFNLHARINFTYYFN